MGFSSKHQSSTTNTSGTSTTTPNVPQWGVDSLKGLNDMIMKLGGSDPQSFVTGPSDLQTKAFQGASNLGGWQSGQQAATDLATKVGAAGPNTAQFSSAGPTNTAAISTTGNPALATTTNADAAGIFGRGIAKYLNPETENVVNTTLADFDHNAGETRAQQQAQGAQAGAFGGSRWGIQQGETEGQLSRARASTDANLRSTAFDRATTLANLDADRIEQARISNARAQDAASQFNATEQNTNATNNTNARNQGAEFNTGALNQGAQFDATGRNANATFNAGQQDNSLNRDQGVAGLLGSLATALNTNNIADVSTQSTLGDTQHQLAQDKATAPISLAQTIAQLLGQNQLPLLTGQTSNYSGTSTTKSSQSPSTFDQIGQGISTASKLAALFG